MRFLPSKRPFWSRLSRKVPPFSTSSWRPIARPRRGKPILTRSRTITSHSLGMASDRGIGLVAGYRDACPEALWVGDHFHEFRGLFAMRLQWEKKAYSAI